MLSKRNVKEAFAHFKYKADGKGSDGVLLSDLQEYWSLNHEKIEKQLFEGNYQPAPIQIKEIINGNGKRRVISILATVDRLIARLLCQKLKRYLEKDFLPCSFAFQENKGIQAAVNQCRLYLESGCTCVVSVDIQNFFDEIDQTRMMKLIEEKINDETVLKLIRSYINCNVEIDNKIERKNIGLVQGSSISPVLSNLYLHDLDLMMESKGYCWVRFADDINIYVDSIEEGNRIIDDVTGFLKSIGLKVNDKKTGIFNPYEEIYLGYDFYKGKTGIEVKKHIYKKTNIYSKWHTSAIEKVNHEYHLINNGVINKKDFSLLFESEKNKYFIPVEVADQINIYSNITVSADALNFITEQGIRIAFIDKYGNPKGYYIPQNDIKSGITLVNQFKKYVNEQERLIIAKKLEKAGFHNMRSNLRYYQKKKRGNFEKEIEIITNMIAEVDQAKTVQDLMLLEGRCRQQYYLTFNKIINRKEFEFTKRVKRPPKDCINALISFINTLLYNELILIIYKTTLDGRIGIIHSTTRRSFTLNLDIADLFKPIIVDRIIFTIININQIKADKHFEEIENGGIYLNNEGKRIIISKFDEKLNDTLVINNKTYTYRQILEKEIWKYLNYINEGTTYRPYKYY